MCEGYKTERFQDVHIWIAAATDSLEVAFEILLRSQAYSDIEKLEKYSEIEISTEFPGTELV